MRLVILTLIALSFVALFAQVAAAEDLDAGAEVAATTDTTPDTPAPTPPDIEEDPIGSIQLFIESIKTGNWRMVGSLALVLIMLILSKVRDKIKFFSGDRGGAVLVMLLGLLGGFSAALAADATFDWKLVLGIVGTVWTGVGGWTWFKRLVDPQES
jgi:hypothetical protein